MNENMRKPKYLSPSSLAKFERCYDEFFYNYICPKNIRPAREPQTDPMSVGSAFDALVKAEIYEDQLGRGRAEADGYTRCELIKSQCQEHTLPLSLAIACDAFDQYRGCGAYDALVEFVSESTDEPRMEFDVVSTIGGVPLLGKPDLHFYTKTGCHVITDWKVSGSCSKRGLSPQQGYQMSRSIHKGRGLGEPHRGYIPSSVCGASVNKVPMNETTDYWADQLSTYAWCLGEEVGSENFICRIEQLACRPCPPKDGSGRLRIKCVTHQSTVDSDYQAQLLERYQRCWRHVMEGHYFPDLTKSQSDTRCNRLIRDLSSPVIHHTRLTPGAFLPIDFGA